MIFSLNLYKFLYSECFFYILDNQVLLKDLTNNSKNSSAKMKITLYGKIPNLSKIVTKIVKIKNKAFLANLSTTSKVTISVS